MSIGASITILPSRVSNLLATGFHPFESSSGLRGLAMDSGKTLDILAVASTRPRTGQMRTFISDMKLLYTKIRVHEIWSDVVQDALTRYGFTPFLEINEHGKQVEGMEWKTT